ncbi:hypothetical protein [Pedobacter jamesrossensis]|uniref:Four helix bundle sensory module for signal transduction n=1 Tax=Pedobacter jamesrossensis TaxID=1908238 RepID=A0ABV8NRX5_9SPHI
MKSQNHASPLWHRLLEGTRSCKAKFKNNLLGYPRLSLGIMMLMMICSGLVCFTVNRHGEEKSGEYFTNLKFSMPDDAKGNADALMEIISLQAELKTFLDKKIPSLEDSLRMERLLNRIGALNQKLKDHEKN